MTDTRQERVDGMKKIMKALKTVLMLTGLCTICWLIIHRRVVWSWLTGAEMPEMPEWHKKFIHKS